MKSTTYIGLFLEKSKQGGGGDIQGYKEITCGISSG